MKKYSSKYPVVPFVVLSLLVSLCGCREQTSTKETPSVQPLRTSSYTYSCWLNGWRKNKTDKSPEILAIQTSVYDFTLNLANFSKAGFALTPKTALSYAEALSSGTDFLYRLPAAELIITIHMNGDAYRAVNCAAGTDMDEMRLSSAKMWESGRFVQHFELIDLNFQNTSGKSLKCKANLSLVAWSDSLTLTASIAPDSSSAEAWRDAQIKVQLQGQNLNCQTEKRYADPWCSTTTNTLTLTYNSPDRVVSDKGIAVRVSSGTNNVFPVAFETTKNCFIASVPNIKRTFKAGYTDIRDYDEFLITIDNAGATTKELPFLLDFRAPANITGLCPMLCDKDGRPTGIPVQLSKNWHDKAMGSYLMAYSSLPSKPGHTEYLLRISYGFYGTLPSVSHSQLCLIGYSGKRGNGRWDQLAIGCWGETICFDMDMSLVNMAVTDVRMLMARNGAKGSMWNWTDAGWGGDWFEMLDAAGDKLAFKDMKTAYLAHGPCLSDVRHVGFYGAQREVSLKAEIHTLRTDDYARTFQRLRYTFNVQAANTNISFFRQGRSRHYFTPKIAYGNQAGLISEQDVPLNLKSGQLFIDRLPLQGKGPWWIAFPGATHTNGREWGTGYRALVIRSYNAVINGQSYTQPTFSMPVNHASQESVDLDVVLVPPREVATFKPGDVIDLDVEWITLPKKADDYYGANETFRNHLSANPASWKTTYREAVGNDLQVIARGGKVLNRYPIVIQAEALTIDVSIKGGVGFVPIRFERLPTTKDVALFEVVDRKEIRLDQSVHGHDFWQTDYDEGSHTYTLTYNLPLDNKATSTWRLKSIK